MARDKSKKNGNNPRPGQPIKQVGTDPDLWEVSILFV